MSPGRDNYKRYTSGKTWRKTKTGERYRDGLQDLHVRCSKNVRWPCTYCYPPKRRANERRKAIADADYDPLCNWFFEAHIPEYGLCICWSTFCCCAEFDPVLGSYTTETEKK